MNPDQGVHRAKWRRYLPHRQPVGCDVFLTWRLHGAPVPVPVVARTDGERFVLEDRQLDAATCGPMWLREPSVAEAVVRTLREAEARGLCRWHAWVLMGNHAHGLATAHADLPELMRFVKGVSAANANRVLGREGRPFWAREYFDRWIRDERQWHRAARYVVMNPVRAGLCERPQDWPWSSVSGVEDLRW